MIGAQGSSITDYLPLLLLAVLAFSFATVSLFVSSLLRPRKPTADKLSAYECGIEPLRLPRGERFSVRFYVVAMLFIIFDIETIFLFPWAVEFRALGVFGLVEMAIFIALVFVAYIYIWRKGGFDWSTAPIPVDDDARAEPTSDQGRERVGAG